MKHETGALTSSAKTTAKKAKSNHGSHIESRTNEFDQKDAQFDPDAATTDVAALKMTH